jgi:hypothetical protein
MEIDPGIHIVMHSVLALKTGCDRARRLGLPGAERSERRAERAEPGVERRKGKADKRAPLVSCPWWKTKESGGAAGGLGRSGMSHAEKKRKEGGLGCARVGQR